MIAAASLLLAVLAVVVSGFSVYYCGIIRRERIRAQEIAARYR